MEEIKFENYDLSKEVLQAVSDMGFEELSPIQAGAIPNLLDGVDVIGQAQTGTGKTAAFGIPIVERVDPSEKYIQAMVLCPTRELCIQVAEEISKLAKYKKGLKVLPIYGGQPIERQISALKKGVQIVIGTPGRTIDHIRRKTIRTGEVKIFVLDEADEMFDMGFRDDIELVLGHMPMERQTTFFSATMAPDIVNFAKKYQSNPKIVKVVHKEMTVPKVNQFYYDLQPHMKTEILSRVLDIYNPTLTVVFCNTKKMVDELASSLRERGYSADGLHGDLKQQQRDAVMRKFRTGSIDILVATDVAARGIDVDDVDLVINYDLPQDDEYYVHRIGRTARAGREGTAISFVSGREAYRLRDIQRYTKTKMARHELPTLTDIEARSNSQLISKIREELERGTRAKSDPLIQQLLDEDYNPVEISGAILDLFMREQRVSKHESLEWISHDKKSRSRVPSRMGGKRDRDRDKYSRLFVSVGKKDQISERHVLSSILNETGIHKNDVGKIDIFDNFTFVDISSSKADRVASVMNKRHIRGQQVSVEKAKNKKKK